jgi:myo-inositol-hexaphosphate 3-phosphohydrolase
VTTVDLSPSGIAVPTGDLPGWTLSFTDDFLGTSLNLEEWHTYSGRPNGAPLAQWDPSHVVVQDGLLELQTYQDPEYPGLWTSGGLKLDLSQTYGKYLVRFRMDEGDGVAGISLLWPTDKDWPYEDEIDFAEDAGGDRSYTTSTLHYGTATDHHMVHRKTSGDFSEWHTLGVEWLEGKLNYTLDGVVWAIVDDTHVPNIPMQMAIQTQTWDVYPTTPPLVTMQVDWIAVYAPALEGTVSLTFQQGVNGYIGTEDTSLRQATPTTSQATSTILKVDGDDPFNTFKDAQSLLRFDDIFGVAANQIPLGATIISAQLQLNTTNVGDGASVYRMLRPWTDGDTWGSLVNGIQADGVEAAQTPDMVIGKFPLGTQNFDVTASVQAWADGAANLGWAFLPLGDDGWDFSSSEGVVHPTLSVTYSFDGSPTNTAPVAGDDAAATSKNTAVRVFVLANDSDPDGDQLSLGGIAIAPTHGTATTNLDGTITYTPTADFVGADSFVYMVNDGHGGADDASVNVTITDTSASGVRSFQQGTAGYTGTFDTMVRAAAPNLSYGNSATLSVDSSDPSGFANQVLLRFGDVFGTASEQIPLGTHITSATLKLNTNDVGSGASLYQMLMPWSEDSTWTTLGSGIQANGIEAASTASLLTGKITANGATTFDVTSSVQHWADGAANNGWAFLPSGSDGWDFSSSEGVIHPILTITYGSGPPPPDPQQPFDVTVAPFDLTPSVAGSGDRADDPAVVLHPTDLSQSVILGTDKASGSSGQLYAYDLNGNVLDTASVGHGINNVDVRYQFNLGGTPTTLIAATDRPNTDFVFYTYDFANHDLRSIGTAESGSSYGLSLGYVDGTYYAYGTTDSGGAVRQYALDGSSGTVTATLVRTIAVGGRVEGVTVDDETGQLYVSEESVGIWRYDASANGGTSRVLVDKVGTGGHLTADVEGLAIYHKDDGTGFLIASSQGEDAFEFYDTTTNAWRGTLALDGVTHTDGIDATNANLGGAYSGGLFITQVNDSNKFALTSWSDIAAATGLPIDTGYDARVDPYQVEAQWFALM